MNFPKKLQQKLDNRNENQALRSLGKVTSLIDFSSNDYLGFATSETIFEKAHQFLLDSNIKQNGSTGSRLLSGNYQLYDKVEIFLAKTHQVESALIFNSGYDANIGFFSSVPQRNDVILYDEFIHASIRDGIQLSNAKAYKFKHNDIEDLVLVIERNQNENSEIYVVTESVFSMDGDAPNLEKLVKICQKNNAHLIVDEAHAVGVFGTGLIQQFDLQNEVFARIITFGKALGCHGAAILGSKKLQQYLVNFARSFIYTTALPPDSLATIFSTYQYLVSSSAVENSKLKGNIEHFISEVKRLQLNFIPSCSSIHCCVIGGNKQTKNSATQLQQKGFDVKPILSPTVPQNQERLRFCLHSYNSTEEITNVLELLSTFV